jgi:hypothetical protein
MKTISLIETNRSGRKNADYLENHYHPSHRGSPTAPSLPFYCTNRLLADGRNIFHWLPSP